MQRLNWSDETFCSLFCHTLARVLRLSLVPQTLHTIPLQRRRWRRESTVHLQTFLVFESVSSFVLVLVDKPITPTYREAISLQALAKSKHLVLCAHLTSHNLGR